MALLRLCAAALLAGHVVFATSVIDTDGTSLDDAANTTDISPTPTPTPTLLDPYATANRVSCAVGTDLHGMMCKLIFTKTVGVEVVCHCHRACNSSGFGGKCAEYWGHEIQKVVEEDTGCTDYSSQMAVPGYWAKCRQKSNPDSAPSYYMPPDEDPTDASKKSTSLLQASSEGEAPEEEGIVKDGVPIDDKEDAALVEGKGAFVAKAVEQQPAGESPAEAEERDLQGQIDALKEENAKLAEEKSAWLSAKDKLKSEIHELQEANAKMVDQVVLAKTDAARSSASFEPPRQQVPTKTLGALMPGEAKGN